MKRELIYLYLFLRMTRILLSDFGLNKYLINTFAYFPASYI